jgi:hypothetical protein
MVLACILAIALCPAAGLFVVGFLFPSCTCCTTTLTCNNCNTGTAPVQMQLTITGITNGSCSDCTSLNATWVADGTVSSNICIWDVSINNCVSGSDELCLIRLNSNFTAYAPTWTIGLLWCNPGLNFSAVWQDAVTSNPDDCGFSGKTYSDIGFGGFYSGKCTVSSSSITVDAI